MSDKKENQDQDKKGKDDEQMSVHSVNSDAGSKTSEKSDHKEQQTKKLGKYGFRLSPEEQELAYELKATLMKKLDQQNAKISSELEIHKRFQRMKKTEQRAQTARNTTGSADMARVNAVRLMKLYEKQALKAEMRVKELEHQLEESQDLARRYRDMYLKEKGDKGGGGGGNGTDRSQQSDKSPRGDSANKMDRRGSANSKDSTAREKKKKDKVTEDDLDDDEAMYKRHVAKLADTKSVRTTAPIRVVDVIRKSEVVHIENEELRREVQRLKWDNAHLIKKTKHAEAEKDKLLHNIATSEYARTSLLKRLEKEKTDHQRLQRSLTRQASDWIQTRKESHEAEENRRWTNVLAAGPYDADTRSKHPVKRNVDLPRKMYPVEDYDRTPKIR